MSIFDSPTAQNWTSMSISGGPTAHEMDLNVHIWRFPPHIIGPQCPYLAVPPHIIGPQCPSMDFKTELVCFQKRRAPKNGAFWRALRTEISHMRLVQGQKLKLFQGSNFQVTAAVSQQLWTSGGALVQRGQEPNIPFGESLTSINSRDLKRLS